MNTLEAYRQQNTLTFKALAQKAGNDQTSVFRHCKAKQIPAEAVLLYEANLGIPRWLLRPDLWPCPTPQHVSGHQEAPTGT
jgi:hypothetical protein